ncbi:MAG: pectate lyase [Prolixibacteraceae bacterium]|nr:pectate lyase [Prolixibacteraceae bacterium]
MRKLLNVRLLCLALLLNASSFMHAQTITDGITNAISMEPFGDSMRHWYGIRDNGNIIQPKQNQARYTEAEITKIADNILLYQRNNGGWPKNYDMQAILLPEQIDSLVRTKNQTHTTFDNSTTYTHIEYLATAYSLTHIEKYKDACIKGISFVLGAQYANGGWPQYFPIEQGNYSRRITFNDGAYIGIMEMLKKIVDDNPNFTFVGNNLRENVKVAYEKGLECILKMQIVDNGRLTVWCQQHDEITLQPAWARAFEPPSICNGESAGIVQFLMSIEKPDQKIINSIQAAVKWFQDSKILNTRVETVKAPTEKSKYMSYSSDRVVVTDSSAPPIWTRFYELRTQKPLFCDRNSKFLYSMAEVSRERRVGYAWYTYAPQKILDKYPKWEKKFSNPAQKSKVQKLSVSENGRFLNLGDQPFFWLGDTGWLLLSKLNREETEKYLEDRKQKGFNVIQVMVLHSLSAVNIQGDSALVRKNIGTPKNGGYWENLDFAIDLAENKGLFLALVPVWGSNVKAGHVTRTQAEAYAEFLAKRYKDKSNIVWMNGGDLRGDDSIQIWKTIGNTLKKYDPNHLVTYHPFGRTQSSTWFHNESWLDFNMFQSGHRNYAQDTARSDLRYGEDNWRYVLSDYIKSPVKPTLDGEPSYEGIPHGLHDTLQVRWNDNDVRRYAYWSVFSGACGYTYGHNSVMQFYTSAPKAGAYGARMPWTEALSSPGASQLKFLKSLMLDYHLEELVPDQSILAEPGERYNHLVALKGKNCLLVYTYNGRTIRLKSDQLGGDDFEFDWYNPRNGKFVGSGTFKKKDIHEFDPPGEQKDGEDWVLILKQK